MHVYAPGPREGFQPAPAVSVWWELGQEPFRGWRWFGESSIAAGSDWRMDWWGGVKEKASDGSQPFALTILRRATVEKVREKVNI